MKLHQKIIEDAAVGAVGAGAIAAYPSMPLFARLSKRPAPAKIFKLGKKRGKKKDKNKLGIREHFYASMNEDVTQTGENTFDPTEVIAKLKSLENKESTDRRDTTTFGLEDDRGHLVRVTVRNDQAAAFEAALQAMLNDADQKMDERTDMPELAELLFKLKDRFDIVDVEFPEVSEDEEQETELAGQETTGETPAPGEGDLGAMVGGEEGGLGGELGGGGTEEVKGLLTQVIDMMKADAEARKAEAHAKAAEAKQREAELGAEEAMTRVRQEEQYLDMEAYEKQKKEEDKEAKRLAQLARWKHEMKNEHGADFGEGKEELDLAATMGKGKEEEESLLRRPPATTAQPSGKLSNRVSSADVANFVLSRVK